MNTEQLTNFIIIIDQKSFSAAEEKAYVSKQALLKQMESLEKEVGFSLFVRTHKGVVPTEQGKVFYEGAKKILELKNEVLQDCLALKQNDVIRTSEVEHQVLLRPVIEGFRKKYPEIRFQTVIHPIRSGEFRVENNIMDVGETFLLDVNGVQYDRLTEFPYVAVMRKGHPLANCKEVSLQECSAYPTIYFEIMFSAEFNDLMKQVYHQGKNLIISEDVDHHVDTMYQSLYSDQIFVTFNPFVYYTNDFAIIPLKEGFKQEYGIISAKNHNSNIDKFIQYAKELYWKENPILNRKK